MYFYLCIIFSKKLNNEQFFCERSYEPEYGIAGDGREKVEKLDFWWKGEKSSTLNKNVLDFLSFFLFTFFSFPLYNKNYI